MFAYFWSWERARLRMLESQAGKAYSKARLKVLQTWKYTSLISMTASRWQVVGSLPQLSPCRRQSSCTPHLGRPGYTKMKEVTHSILHIAHYVWHTVRCTLHSARCTVHTAYCTLQTAPCTMGTACFTYNIRIQINLSRVNITLKSIASVSHL